MNEWQDLDIYNLPSDIMVGGAYLFLMSKTGRREMDCFWSPREIMDTIMEDEPKYTFKYRRPEGWPKGCPTCGKDEMPEPKWIGGASPHVCSDPWHDEPELPTHEERITKWWYDGDRWLRVIYIDLDNGDWKYGLSNYGNNNAVTRDWFAGRLSADIPPEDES